ncbi:MAG: aminotransferase class I/II-fold pyridoxal phosphate-dependent enzyme [Candidatus Gastranaerophilaceae bacterium]
MKQLFNNYVQSLETYIMFRIKQKTMELQEELTAKNRAPIYLSMGAPIQAPPKFVTDKLIEILQTNPSVHTYSTPKGEGCFVTAVQERMKNRYGVELDKTEIHSLIGSKEGIANFIRALCNPTTDEKEKDIIMIPDPGYASYGEMIKVSGGIGYSVPLTKENNYMPDLEEVFEQISKDGYDNKKVKALIINYPNNPLGAACTVDYLQKAVDFCKKHNIILMSDAAYIDMGFEGTEMPVSALTCDGAKDVTIEFYSFSKPYAMTGWRLGWACGNKELVSMLGKIKSVIDSGIYKPLQMAGAAVLNSIEGDEYIVKARKGFKVKQDILTEGFKELGWDIDNLYIPSATFYLWLPIPPKYKKSEDFTNDVLKTSGVVLVPGSAFGKYGEGWFRISAVSADGQLKEVIERLKNDGFRFE